MRWREALPKKDASKARIFGESTLVASSELPLVLAPLSKKATLTDGENFGICSAVRRKYEGFDSNRRDAKRERTARKGWCALFWWI